MRLGKKLQQVSTHIFLVLGLIKVILDVFAQILENGDIQRIFVIYQMVRRMMNLK